MILETLTSKIVYAAYSAAANPNPINLNVSPNTTAIKGFNILSTLVGFVEAVALLACVGGVLYGVIKLVGGNARNNGGHISEGREAIIWSTVGGAVAGAATIIVTSAFNLGLGAA